MGGLLRQGTATTVKFGPILDAADGITAETTLAIGTTKIRLGVNGGAFSSPSSSGAHEEEGWYTFGATSSELATAGRLQLKVNDTEALPFFDSYVVLSQSAYDAIISGSGNLGGGSIVAASVTGAVGSVTGDVTITSTSRADLTTDIWSRATRTITGDVTIASTSRADLTTDVWSRAVRTVTEVSGNVTGSVASVSGAVGSVTADVTIASTSRADLTTDIWSRAVRAVTSVAGSVTGNVDGSVGSVTGAVGSVSGAVGSVTADVTIASTSRADLTTDIWSRATRTITGDVTITSTSRADLTTDIWSRGVRLVTGVAGDVTGNVDGNIGGNVTGTVGTLSTTGRDDVWDEIMEGTMTARHSMLVSNAALAGKSTGGGTASNTFRDPADAYNRIVATVTTDGNRSAVTLTLTT